MSASANYLKLPASIHHGCLHRQRRYRPTYNDPCYGPQITKYKQMEYSKRSHAHAYNGLPTAWKPTDSATNSAFLFHSFTLFFFYCFFVTIPNFSFCLIGFVLKLNSNENSAEEAFNIYVCDVWQ
jgi:hypothetical protein